MFKFRLDLLSTCIAVCSSQEQLCFFPDMGLDWRDAYKLASTHNLPRNMRRRGRRVGAAGGVYELK